MERIHKLKSHLEAEAGHGKEGSEVCMHNTRSFSNRLHDVYSVLTKNVAITEKHGGDLIAQVVKAAGVEFIFCLSGGHIAPVLVASKQLGVRIIDVRHEVNAVFAADAVGRLTGRPGVAAVTAGPGVSNTVTAVINAQMAQSPVVLLGGAAATVLQGRGSLQDIDTLAFMKPICKSAYSCRTVRDIVPILRNAFQEAASGVPGVVFVELPLDLLYSSLEMLPQLGSHTRMRARDVQDHKFTDEIGKKIAVPREVLSEGKDTKAYVHSKSPDAPVFVEKDTKQPLLTRTGFSILHKHIHAGAHDVDYDFSPLPVTYPKPKSADIQNVFKLLRKSRTPVFLFGSQAMLHGTEKAGDLAKSLKSLGVPCFLGGMSRGLLGRSCDLHIRQNRGKCLREADLIILFGVVPDFRLDYGRALPSKCPVVSVNRSNDLLLNRGLFWNPVVAAESDPCDFCLQLVDTFLAKGQAGAWTQWAAKLKDGDRAKESANVKLSKEPAFGRNENIDTPLVNPLDICYQIEHTMEEDAILVTDGGDFVATASYILKPRSPLSWMDPGAFGTLGVGGGFALGAALCFPERPIWLIWGDGSCGYSLLEFDTFNRHGVGNVIAIVGNDACWTQIEREQTPMLGDDAACVLAYVDYHKAAVALGGAGLCVSDPDETHIRNTLTEAQNISRQGKSVLVNVKIGRTGFREGSLSV